MPMYTVTLAICFLDSFCLRGMQMQIYYEVKVQSLLRQTCVNNLLISPRCKNGHVNWSAFLKMFLEKENSNQTFPCWKPWYNGEAWSLSWKHGDGESYRGLEGSSAIYAKRRKASRGWKNLDITMMLVTIKGSASTLIFICHWKYMELYTEEISKSQSGPGAQSLKQNGRTLWVGRNRTFSVNLVVLCSCFS